MFNDTSALRRLETILHPYVWRAQEKFLSNQSRTRQTHVVLDVPLLFESGTHRCCDFTVVVTAPKFIQKQRVIQRSGMTIKRMEGIISHQLPDEEKRRRADYVIRTSLGKRFTRSKIVRLLREIKVRSSGVWGPDWRRKRK